MFMLSLKSICSPPFIVLFGSLQPDTTPTDLRPDVYVFRPLCGLRKLPLIATACAAPVPHCVTSFLCSGFILLSVCAKVKVFRRKILTLRTLARCRRFVLSAIRFLLALSISVFACLFPFVSLGMLSMEHLCFVLSLQGLALRFFVFWLLPLSARQNGP